jgi:hypothetical protein
MIASAGRPGARNGAGCGFDLAVEGLTSFTAAQLHLASVLGLAIAGVAFLYASLIVYRTIGYGNSVGGYPSLMTVVLFLGGVQLTAIGILGGYPGRVFHGTKRHPLPHARDYLPVTGCAGAAVGAQHARIV